MLKANMRDLLSRICKNHGESSLPLSISSKFGVTITDHGGENMNGFSMMICGGKSHSDAKLLAIGRKKRSLLMKKESRMN